ncbi:Mucin-19, partial [Cricetulus griseus]
GAISSSEYTTSGPPSTPEKGSHIPEATPTYSEANEVTGETFTWGNGTYKALNGRIFSFESSCTYTFCRDCAESGGDFNIEIKRHSNSEDINEHIANSKISNDCPSALSRNYEVCEDGVQYCDKIIGTYFENCGKVSPLSSEYKKVCVDEYCRTEGGKDTTCDTYSELARLCAYDGPGVFEHWRDDSAVVCEKQQCPGKHIYKECGPSNPPTCSNVAPFQDSECVDPTTYYNACIEEACACDMEGKYLGFCTAVAMYAEACNAAGVCVSWRKPNLCPVYCDYYNAPGECSWHYEPCVTVTAKTCKDQVIGQKFSSLLEDTLPTNSTPTGKVKILCQIWN